MATGTAGRANLATGHLDYYLQHGINPVHYDMSNQAWHLQRRASLYRCLGIHPLTVRHARVLEVAVGTGQNSLYLAGLRPRSYTLVEPNPVAIRDIKALYSRPEYAAWRPELFEGKFEDFTAEEPFDLVVCENWLGQGAGDRALLRKLGSLVAPGGLMALTTMTPLGFLPNVLRRLLAVRLGCWERSFQDGTQLLVDAFSSHLATIAGMTRTATDWVQDNLMNPHYFNICLTMPMVAEDLGDAFTFLGSSPDFAVDWRWFKSLYGEGRNFNGHFLGEYYSNCHNFLDYRRVLPRGDLAHNRTLEAAAWNLLETAAEVDGAARLEAAGPSEGHPVILDRLQEVVNGLRGQAEEHLPPLLEFEQLYRRPQLTVADVRTMGPFAGLFGRETVYVSLEKAA